MRAHAQTYPQLANQAIAEGFDAGRLARLKQAHDLAQAMVDGMYRANGTPFLCHLVRTASIVMSEALPQPVVEAALLHATYLLHRFRHTSRHGLASRHRRRLQAVVGDEVEAIVSAYAALPWDSEEDRAAHLASLPGASELERQIIAIALANDLEDFLDAAMHYGGPQPSRSAVEAHANHATGIAQALGLHELARELEEAFEIHLASEVPSTLRTPHAYGFELGRRNGWRATIPERVAWRLARALRR